MATRRRPFSAKQKKLQLQAKRQEKQKQGTLTCCPRPSLYSRPSPYSNANGDHSRPWAQRERDGRRGGAAERTMTTRRTTRRRTRSRGTLTRTATARTRTERLHSPRARMLALLLALPKAGHRPSPRIRRPSLNGTCVPALPRPLPVPVLTPDRMVFPGLAACALCLKRSLETLSRSASSRVACPTAICFQRSVPSSRRGPSMNPRSLSFKRPFRFP